MISLTAPATSTAHSAGPGSTAAPPLAGTWRVATGSIVGYRVKEVLFGQDNIAVGRTGSITRPAHDNRHDGHGGPLHRADGHDQE
jgi:hypothetical protein